VTKEWQDGLWVASTYDELGRRTQVTSSLGANILTARDEMGRATHMAASQSGQPAWAARFGFNGLGQEIERLLPGGVVSNWQYDAMGRPARHRVTQGPGSLGSARGMDASGVGSLGSARRETYRRAYEWDVNHRLKSMTNELTNGETVYGYDEFSSLVQSGFRKSRISSTDVLHRGTDEVGNLYEAQDRSDRIYGAGSRLEKSGIDTKELRNVFQGGQGELVTRGTEYSYDGEGNLIRKDEPDGGTWQYEYYGNGMLSKVVRPDGAKFAYKYDPLGRRIEKAAPEGVKRFLWDGDRPLHEWDVTVAGAGASGAGVNAGAYRNETAEHRSVARSSAAGVKGTRKPDAGIASTGRKESLVTWVFDDGFVPTAKLTSSGHYSIISDFLGTPVEAYDAKGERVWSMELDIYGRMKELTGDTGFIPFRYQGQYADEGTGLYYNRFRYYDPATGQYTQQDPIGLAGETHNLYQYTANPIAVIDPFGLDWNYVLVNILGKVYYHGRAAESATMHSVAARHAGTVGLDGARFGPGDILRQTTPVDTRPIIVKGIEGHGTRLDGILGRGSQNVRGNVIEGVSNSNQKGMDRLDAGSEYLNGREPSQLPAQKELTYDGYDKARRSTTKGC
jgi:RHS repeat-associated protein